MTYPGSAKTVAGSIVDADSGGFVAVASTGDLDRDNERIQPGCFNPLPGSVGVHLDHTMRAADLVARARPYYNGDQLMIDARFGSTTDAQLARQKVIDGVITDVSIVFRAFQWQNLQGIRTCVAGELLACDLVSVPSNTGARITSVRGTGPTTAAGLLARGRTAAADATLAMARVELAEAKAFLDRADRPEATRQRSIDALLAEAAAHRRTARQVVNEVLRRP